MISFTRDVIYSLIIAVFDGIYLQVGAVLALIVGAVELAFPDSGIIQLYNTYVQYLPPGLKLANFLVNVNVVRSAFGAYVTFVELCIGFRLATWVYVKFWGST